jgi:hypothetical protein
LTAALLGNPLAAAHAAVVKFQASGTVDQVLLDPTLPNIVGVKLGDPFTFTYSFDDTTLNTSAAPWFSYPNALRSLVIDIANQHFVLDVTTGSSISGTNDDFHPGTDFSDSYSVVLSRTDGQLQTYAMFSMNVFGSSPPAALTSRALTDTPPSLSLFGGGLMHLRFLVPDPTSPLPGVGKQDFVRAQVNSLALVPSAVPVPAAVWLISSGLGVLGFFGRRTDCVL